MGITRSTLKQNNGNLPLSFFGGKVLPGNLYLCLGVEVKIFSV